MSHRRYLLILALLVFSLHISVAQGTTLAKSSDGKDTGQTIRSIVSSAIDTAFPVIGKIMDLFKGKKDDAKVGKADVQAAITSAQAEFKTNAKEKLQDVTIISKELGIMQAFGIAGNKANKNLTTITNLLSQAQPSYTRIGTEWDIAKRALANVLTIKPEDIRQNVSDESIKERLANLQDARNDLMVRIDANLDAARKNDRDFSKVELMEQMRSMADLLKGFDSLAAIELSMLQDEVDKLAKWANSPAGSLEGSFKKPDSVLLQIASDAATRAKKAAQR